MLTGFLKTPSLDDFFVKFTKMVLGKRTFCLYLQSLIVTLILVSIQSCLAVNVGLSVLFSCTHSRIS